jgi:hypothetical protein
MEDSARKPPEPPPSNIELPTPNASGGLIFSTPDLTDDH